jgi:hypothetical protein
VCLVNARSQLKIHSQFNQSYRSNTLLIIDGSYFKKSSKDSKSLNGRRIDFTRLLRFLVRQIGSEFSHMYWIDSARPDEDNNHFLKVFFFPFFLFFFFFFRLTIRSPRC